MKKRIFVKFEIIVFILLFLAPILHAMQINTNGKEILKEKIESKFLINNRYIVYSTPDDIIKKALLNPSQGMDYKSNSPPEAFTRYEPPYDSCFDWAIADVPYTTYASAGSNHKSVAIGVRAGAFIGGFRGESRQLIALFSRQNNSINSKRDGYNFCRENSSTSSISCKFTYNLFNR